jgi:hypothetical protein
VIDDLAAAERGECDLDAFINRRSKGREEANGLEAAWAESTRRVNEKRRRTNRWAWVAHHDRMTRTHQALADEHADERSRLLTEILLEEEGDAKSFEEIPKGAVA